MRHFLSGFITAVVAIAISAFAVSASEGVPQVRHDSTVKTGQRERIGHSWHINPDCSVTGVPTVRVIDPPLHGKITLARVREVITDAKGRTIRCNSLKLPVIAYFYQSTAGYVGSDRFVARVSFGNGDVTDRIQTIRVQK